MGPLRYVCARWPDEDVPPGEPIWIYSEIDDEADAVVRQAEVFPNGEVTRNSVEIEGRGGQSCTSTICISVAEYDEALAKFEATCDFIDEPVRVISKEEFEIIWAKGVDTPVWNVNAKPRK